MIDVRVFDAVGINECVLYICQRVHTMSTTTKKEKCYDKYKFNPNAMLACLNKEAFDIDEAVREAQEIEAAREREGNSTSAAADAAAEKCGEDDEVCFSNEEEKSMVLTLVLAPVLLAMHAMAVDYMYRRGRQLPKREDSWKWTLGSVLLALAALQYYMKVLNSWGGYQAFLEAGDHTKRTEEEEENNDKGSNNFLATVGSWFRIGLLNPIVAGLLPGLIGIVVSRKFINLPPVPLLQQSKEA